MAVVMKAVYNVFGKIIGMEAVESDDRLETIDDQTGEVQSMDVSEALEIEAFDLTTTPEIQLTTTDAEVAEVGKGVMLGHPVHLDIKAVGTDAVVSTEAISSTNWDGGELT